MRKLFEDVRTSVERFIEQRDQLTMVATLGLREQVALCKVLQSMDEGASRHVFWIFTEPFSNATAYGLAVASSASARYQAMLEALDPETSARFPAFPQSVLEPRLPAEERLRALLVFARSLIPSLDEQQLVAAFIPQQIDDAAAMAVLFDAVLAYSFPVPWCHHMRVIVREDPAKPGLASKLAGKRTQAYRPDLSDAALQRAMENEVNDAGAPLEKRMQSLTVLAGMDSSHRRTDQALEKYELLASYHTALGNLPALALALNGMGEACAIAQRTDDARGHFERALVPALDAKDVPTLSNIAFNLARMHQGQRAWALAVEYYEGLSTLAKAALNAPLQLICHEQRGVCLRELGQLDAALDEWRAGAKLGEGIGMSDQQLSLLRRSSELLESRGRTSELRELERQMATLRRAGAQELPL